MKAIIGQQEQTIQNLVIKINELVDTLVKVQIINIKIIKLTYCYKMRDNVWFKVVYEYKDRGICCKNV